MTWPPLPNESERDAKRIIKILAKPELSRFYFFPYLFNLSVKKFLVSKKEKQKGIDLKS